MYYGGLLASFDTHDINSIHYVSKPVLFLSTLTTYILLPLTSLIMVRFSIRLNHWNRLSLLYHPVVLEIVLYDFYVHVVSVENYGTKYTRNTLDTVE